MYTAQIDPTQGTGATVDNVDHADHTNLVAPMVYEAINSGYHRMQLELVPGFKSHMGRIFQLVCKKQKRNQLLRARTLLIV